MATTCTTQPQQIRNKQTNKAIKLKLSIQLQVEITRKFTRSDSNMFSTASVFYD